MNDAPMKPHVARTESGSSELAEPHFDDIAVLIAQPVEPIPNPHRDWFGWLEKPRMLMAILAVAGLLGTTALALTLQLPRQREVDSAPAQIRAEESPPEPESPLGVLTEQLKSTAPRTRTRKTRSRDMKPVARRVGVIVYGGSSDRP